MFLLKYSTEIPGKSHGGVKNKYSFWSSSVGLSLFRISLTLLFVSLPPKLVCGEWNTLYLNDKLVMFENFIGTSNSFTVSFDGSFNVCVEK